MSMDSDAKSPANSDRGKDGEDKNRITTITSEGDS